ncbi:MAG TPA: hypothetical protein VNL70_05220, partial [Tepidisphaeraceae bacterium]|nr:hypothetical protein [Tepidisphaeraceae bacterium]
MMSATALAGQPQPSGKMGIVVMAHGGNAEWNRDVEAAVKPLRDRYPIEIAYGMARTSTIRAAVERLENQGVQRIAVVRMFISADSFLPETEYILGLRDSLPGSDSHTHSQAHASGQSHAPKSEASDHDAGHAMHHHAGHESTGHAMETPQPIAPKAQIAISRQGVAESPLIEQILVDRVAALSRNPADEA